MWPRDVNSVRGLAQDGLLRADIWPVTRLLMVDDYSSGPEPERDPKRPAGDLWVFGPEVRGERVYLKLKLLENRVECASFHTAYRLMSLPFATPGDE